jgi:hypothetical protein
MTAGQNARLLHGSIVSRGFATIVAIGLALALAVALVAMTINARNTGAPAAAPNIGPFIDRSADEVGAVPAAPKVTIQRPRELFLDHLATNPGTSTGHTTHPRRRP